MSIPDAAQAITHLQAALALAQEIDLPGETWPILGELGKLYAPQGEQDQAQEAYREAGLIIRRLTATIDEKELRSGHLTVKPVRSILEKSNEAYLLASLLTAAGLGSTCRFEALGHGSHPLGHEPCR